MSEPAVFSSLLAAGRAVADAGTSGRLTADGGQGEAQARDGRLVAARAAGSTLRLADRATGAGLTEVAPAAEVVLHREQVVDALLELELAGCRLVLDAAAPEEDGTAGAAEPAGDPLAEVARRATAWPGMAPLLSRVPAVADGTATVEGLLAADQRTLLAAADGHRTAERLAADLGYGRFELVLLIGRLVAAGALRLHEPAAAPATTGPLEAPAADAAPAPPAGESPTTEAPEPGARDEVGDALDEALAFLDRYGDVPPDQLPPEQRP